MADQTNQYRKNTLYVTNQIHRWLWWLADVQEHATAESIADDILRTELIKRHPNIEQAEVDYQKGRKALNDAAKAFLKTPTP
jgi:hypothetical protein